MSNIEGTVDLRPPDPQGPENICIMSLRSATQAEPPLTQTPSSSSKKTNQGSSPMEEEPSPVDQSTQRSTQRPQWSETDGQPQEGTATTMNTASAQKGPAEPLGPTLQAHADPDPSDGGAPQGTLPEPQGVNPDVNMAELPDEIIDEAEDTIRALKGDIQLTRLGLASYYPGCTDLAIRRESIIDINTAQLQKAAAIIIALLDLGIPNPEETAFTGLVPSSWHRLVALLLGATLRGAERTPDILKQGAADIRPCLDQFTVHNGVPIPETQGDLLRDQAAQLAGALDARPPIGGGDANPETFFDAIKLKLNANYEHIAEHEARKEAALWTQRFTAGLYNNELGTIIKKVQAMLRNAEWAEEATRRCIDELQEEYNVRHALALKEAKKEVEYKARRAGKEEKTRIFRLAISLGQKEALEEAEAHLQRLEEATIKENKVKLRQWAENQLVLDKAARQGELTRLADEEYLSALEKEKGEARRRAETDAQNWAVAYKAEKTEALQKQLDAAVAGEDRQAVAIAAIKVGLEFGGMDPTRVPPPARKKKRTPKSSTAAIAVAERGRSESRAGERKRSAPDALSAGPPTEARALSPARAMSITPTQKHASLPSLTAPTPLYGIRHAPGTAPEAIQDRNEMEEIIARIHTPAPSEAIGTEGSMHRPAGEGGRVMLDPIELPQDFSNRDLRGPHSSVHNPENAMQVQADPSPAEGVATPVNPSEEGEWGDERDSSEAPPELTAAAFGGTLTPEFAALVAVVQGMLSPLRDDISMLTARLDKREFGNPASSGGTPPTKPKPQAAPKPKPTPNPVPARVDTAPPPTNVAPLPARRGWNKMAETGINITDTAVRQQARTAQRASEAASAQGRTPAGNPRQGATAPRATQTEVTVVRYGGFEDTAREKALRARAPQGIVLDVRTALEKHMESPIKVLGGRWSSAVEKTGNFTFVLAGDVGEDAINAAKTYLCGPFPDADVIPNAGWVWVQLRGVTTTDADGNLWDQQDLLRETRQNPVFERVPLCFPPFWQVPPHKIQTETSTVMLAFRDVTGDTIRGAQEKGVYLFGRRAKFVVCGDHPTVIQCGRCHELGHHTNSPVCRTPRTATRCFYCGGAHDSKAHNYHCKGAHEVAGVCDCRLKCFVCGKFGHHARGRGCPKRGDFAPPRLASAQAPRVPTVPAGGDKGKETENALPPPQPLPTAQEGEDWTPVSHKTRRKKTRTEPPPVPAPTLTPRVNTAPALRAVIPTTLPTPAEAPGPITSKPRARRITTETDKAREGETYDEMLGRQAVERSAARWAANHPQPTAVPAAPETPTTAPTEAEKLDHILNNAPGPLSGPGPRFITKERLVEMDAERTLVYRSDGTAMSVWKTDLNSAPPPNAVIVATEPPQNSMPPRLDER